MGLSYDEYMIIKSFKPSKRQDKKAIYTLELSFLDSENLKILSTETTYIDTIWQFFSQENKNLNEKAKELKEFYKNS
ncbi:MAG: hypothetical protein PUB96_06880 [Helicobacteraceae bacterium]|nr:hypothetical protein [Helicobacteraceae bacterium]